MASGQISRKENITTERKIPGENDNVPEMTTRVEKLSVKEKELPQGSVEASKGGAINKDRAGKAIGNAGERGKVREVHEVGPNFQSLPDRNENQSHLDHARVPVSANVAENTLGENATREKLNNRTRVVTGTPQVKEQNRALGKGQVVAERGGKIVDLEAREGEEEFGRGRVVGAENQDAILEKNVAAEEKERARERAKEATKETLNNAAQTAQQKAAQAKDATVEKGQKGYEATKDTVSNAAKTAADKAAQAKDTTLEKGQQGYEATKDTVSNAAKTAAEKAAQAKDVAAEKAAQAKDVAAEKAAQAKDAAAEKGQQGYEATKGTVSNAAKTAAEKAAQAKNATLEKTQQGLEATRDTVSNAAKTAADYAAPVAEKTKTAAEKAKCAAVQAKDVTVEKGKTAAEMAGKAASVAGWTATHYATQLTVDGTKAAASAVQGAVGYVAPKASELAAKSVETVKNLAASAGENAKDFTARKKDESWREYEAQKPSQPQEGEEVLPSSEGTGKNVSNYTEKVITPKVVPGEERTQALGTNLQEKGRGSNVIPNTGETETVENVVEKGRGSNVIPNTGETETVENVLVKEQGEGGEKIERKVLEKKNEGGSDDVKIAVTETK